MKSLVKHAIQYTSQNKRMNDGVKIKINYGGNATKNMHVAVEESLKKLRTSYIDILYVHIWEWGSRYEST